MNAHNVAFRNASFWPTFYNTTASITLLNFQEETSFHTELSTVPSFRPKRDLIYFTAVNPSSNTSIVTTRDGMSTFCLGVQKYFMGYISFLALGTTFRACYSLTCMLSGFVSSALICFWMEKFYPWEGS